MSELKSFLIYLLAKIKMKAKLELQKFNVWTGLIGRYVFISHGNLIFYSYLNLLRHTCNNRIISKSRKSPFGKNRRSLTAHFGRDYLNEIFHER